MKFGMRWLSLGALLFLFATGGCKKSETRWDKAAEEAVPTKAAPEQAGGKFNRCFPPEGVSGYTRVFTQEKEGFAEAKLKKDGTDVATLSVSDTASEPEVKAKFGKSTESVDGHPLITVGKNQSALLVKDRYQVKVSSQTLDASARKELLQRFDLKTLASL